MSSDEIVVTAPARLAFTLINLGKMTGRVNGGAGVSILNPSFSCRVVESDQLTLHSAHPIEYEQEILAFLGELLKTLKVGAVEVEILSQIPRHSGFGSKTATLLAVGNAVAQLFKREIAPSAMAHIAKRGGTSGLGINLFYRGGFMVDGGHSAPPITSDPQAIFVPSRFSKRDEVPPIIYHGSFPWPLVVVLPVGEEIQGERELALFHRLCPMPLQSVYEIAYTTCFEMVTGIAVGNYHLVCQAINALQRCYWKGNQLAEQSSQVRYVVENGRKNGFDAIGLSSNGPALYGLTRDENTVTAWLMNLKRRGVIRDFWLTLVPQHGALFQRSAVRREA